MSRSRSLDRTLALAGVFQAAALVKQLAWNGKLDQSSFESNIYSLFQIDAVNVAAIYGGIDKLRFGLQVLIKLLQISKSSSKSNKIMHDQDIARYGISLLHLERKLIKRKSMLQLISNRIKKANMQIVHFSMTHQNVIASLASIYLDTIGTFNFRLNIEGEEHHLATSNNLNKIRALLLAGIRSAVLWRQLGGSRWQLIFNRNDIIKDVNYWLQKHYTKNSN